MLLNRPKIIHRVDNGELPNGERATQVVEDQTAVGQILLGNGSAAFDGVTSVAITDTFSDNRYNININGNRVLYIVAHVVALGAIDGLECLIEFNSPDFPQVVQEDAPDVLVTTDEGLWIPSKEGANREGNESVQVWGPLIAGNYVLRSREEFMHCVLARFSFRSSSATSPDGATHIKLSWYHDGKIATVAEQ